MDKVSKALKKLKDKEKKGVKEALEKIKKGDLSGLDVKKLKDRDDIYRIRRGDIRIIVQHRDGEYFVLTIERRSDTTYK